MNDNLKKLALSHIFYRLGFISAIYILFFQYIGFTFESIGLFGAITSITILLVDIPSGVLADRIGRKYSVFLSYLSWFLLMVLFAFSSANWITLVLAGILNGCDFSFRSGADSALIYDILKISDQEDSFLKVKGQFSALGLISSTIGMLVGGFFFSLNPRLPYYLQIGAMGCAIILVLFVQEPTIVPSEEHSRKIFSHMKDSVRFVLGNRKLLWITLFSLCFGVFIEAYWDIYSQFHFLVLGVPEQFISFIFAAFLLLGALGASVVHHLVDRLGEKANFYGAVFLQGLIFLGMSILTSWWGMSIVVGLLVMNREMGGLVVENYENRHIASHQRATVLSTMSSLRNSIFGGPIIILFFGWLFDRVAFSSLMFWTALSVLVLGGILLYFLEREEISQ